MTLTRQILVYGFVLFASICTVNRAYAQDDTEARWQRAHVLFRRGDDGAALAEYLEVYKRKPLPVVRYNLGLVEARRGRPVEATEWLEGCLADSVGLDDSLRKYAEDVLAEQKSQIGTLQVISNVPGATIDVDSLEAGRAPKAVRVARGIHVVSVTATGYAPMRKEAKIAGAVEERVEFELVPFEGTVARLTIVSDVPGAEILVDGVIAGKTPILGSIKVEAKEQKIEVRRAGYRTFARSINFVDKDIVSLPVKLDEDVAWIAANGGFLKLGFSEEHAVVTVDGVSRGEYLASLRLAPGVHRLHVERAGFATVERDVDITTGQTTETSVHFEPNPDTLVKFKEDYAFRRKWGIATTATGVGLMVVGGWVAMRFWVDATNKGNDTIAPDQGEALTKGIAVTGTVAAVFGIASISTGIGLLNGNPNPNRYDLKPSGQTLARPWILPTVLPAPGGATIGLVGAF